MSEDGITVRGGAGGTRARLEELAAVGTVLRAVVAYLSDVEAARAVLVTRVETSAPGSAAQARALAALAPLGGPHGVRRAAEEADALADAVRRAAATYAEADAEATRAVRSVVIASGHALGEAGPVAWLLAGLVGLQGLEVLAWLRLSRWTPTPLGAVTGALAGPAVTGRDDAWGALGRALAGPGVLPGLPQPDRGAAALGVAGASAFLDAALPGPALLSHDPVPRGARELLGLASPWLPATALRVLPGTVTTGAPPRDEADVLALVDQQYVGSGALEGQVAVQRLDHADGARTWVVAIPGTEDWALGGSNPLDALTDVQLVAGEADDMTATVLRAMELAGVGAEEPVLLAGHSLGGIVAARVAASSDYRATAVLTAGAPVAGIDLDRRTSALHLEHAHDPVPGLRGLPNPDEVNRTTVVRDLEVGRAPTGTAPAGGPPDISEAHALDTYRTTAALLPAADPSVLGYRAAQQVVLGGDVVAATTWTFTGERVPLGPPHLSDTAPGGGPPALLLSPASAGPPRPAPP